MFITNKNDIIKGNLSELSAQSVGYNCEFEFGPSSDIILGNFYILFYNISSVGERLSGQRYCQTSCTGGSVYIVYFREL